MTFSATQVAGSELSARDAEILEFERTWWRSPGAKEQTIRESFDMSPTRYYQVLNALIDNPAARRASSQPFRVTTRDRSQPLTLAGRGCREVAPARRDSHRPTAPPLVR